MLEIISYNKRELENFIHSEAYQRSSITPIAYHRAISHINNPRLDENSKILFIAYENRRIIGYRTLLADCAYKDSQAIPFAWISGTWVHPEYRRKGIATRLFQAVYENRDGKLMYTNYAPASKIVYDKTGKFKLYKSNPLTRIYLRFDLFYLLKDRNKVLNKLKAFLKFVDRSMNVLNDIKLKLIYKFLFSKSIANIVMNDKIDEETKEFINHHNQMEFTRRDGEIHQWISDYPWVVQDKDKKKESTYFFTDFGDLFKRYYVKVYNDQSQLIAVSQIQLLNYKLTVPYVYTVHPQALQFLAYIIRKLAIQHNISVLILSHHELVKVLKRKKWMFLYMKQQEQHYFATHELVNTLKDDGNYDFQLGTGDVVFT